MATGDTYAQALQSRRGRSVDPTVLNVGMIDLPHGAADQRVGVTGAASAGGEAPGGKGSTEDPQFNSHSPGHMDEHIAPVGENQAPSAHPDWRSPAHQDEHTKPMGESPTAAPLPAAQSAGMGGGDLSQQIGGHVMGHASQNEYEQLKGMGSRPRSLGERAKMDALKSKFEPSGSGKNG